MKRVKLPFVALALLGISACVGPDTTLPPPIESLPAPGRRALAVSPTRNDSAMALAAELAAPTHAMFATLLGRTRRFRVEDEATVRVETAITSIVDEDAAESVVYDRAYAPDPVRRAVVAMTYVVRGAGDRVLLEGTLRGESEVRGTTAIGPPSRVDFETGAYWNSPFGRATRHCLDQLVRRLTEVL